MFCIFKFPFMGNAKRENEIRSSHLKFLCYKDVYILSKTPYELNMKIDDFSRI